MESMKGEEDRIIWSRGPGDTEDQLLTEKTSGEETKSPEMLVTVSDMRMFQLHLRFLQALVH